MINNDDIQNIIQPNLPRSDFNLYISAGNGVFATSSVRKRLTPNEAFNLILAGPAPSGMDVYTFEEAGNVDTRETGWPLNTKDTPYNINTLLRALMGSRSVNLYTLQVFQTLIEQVIDDIRYVDPDGDILLTTEESPPLSDVGYELLVSLQFALKAACAEELRLDNVLKMEATACTGLIGSTGAELNNRGMVVIDGRTFNVSDEDFNGWINRINWWAWLAFGIPSATDVKSRTSSWFKLAIWNIGGKQRSDTVRDGRTFRLYPSPHGIREHNRLVFEEGYQSIETRMALSTFYSLVRLN